MNMYEMIVNYDDDTQDIIRTGLLSNCFYELSINTKLYKIKNVSINYGSVDSGNCFTSYDDMETVINFNTFC